jgi:transposase
MWAPTNPLRTVQMGSMNRHAASTKRDFAALEQRRMQAARLLGTGLTQVEVALRSGVSRQSVSRWAKVLDQSGARGLRFVRAGRKPRLDRRQLEELDRLLRRGLARRGVGWANEEVADAIRRKFGIPLGRTRISELLHDLGFAPQRRQWRPLVDEAERERPRVMS